MFIRPNQARPVHIYIWPHQECFTCQEVHSRLGLVNMGAPHKPAFVVAGVVVIVIFTVLVMHFYWPRCDLKKLKEAHVDVTRYGMGVTKYGKAGIADTGNEYYYS